MPERKLHDWSLKRLLVAVFMLVAGLWFLVSVPATGAPDLLGYKSDRYSPAIEAAIRDLRARPESQTLRRDAARVLIEAGRVRGDADYVVAAETVLFPLLDRPPDAETLALAAITRQYLHDFDAALDYLGTAIRIQPRNPEIRLTRANIVIVQGKLHTARKDCQAIASTGHFEMAFVCNATSDLLSPQAILASERLLGLLNLETRLPSTIQAYSHSVLAETAFYRFDLPAADAHFTRAVELDPTNLRTRALYADLLFTMARHAEALSILRGLPNTDAILVRRGIACKALEKNNCLHKARTTLRARLNAEIAKDSVAHAREEARFLLDVEGDPVSALVRAQKNWSVQKEREDADILVRAAFSANQPAAAEPVRNWMTRENVTAPALTRLFVSPLEH